MKKLMFLAIAAASTVAVAAEGNVPATTEGYYDVTLTTKYLANATKSQSKTFKYTGTTTVYDQYVAWYAEESKKPGFEITSMSGDVKDLTIKKVTVKWTIYATDSKGNYKTKVVSESVKGLYDGKVGKVYLWDTSDKVTVKHGDSADVIAESKTDSKGNEKDQKGYKAYEAPIAMHGQFLAAEDAKAAGGFTGGTAKATDGTVLDYAGLTAFGTGTAKDGNLKSVSGNVAGKYPNNLNYGCYGTWKVNLDSKSYTSLNAALLKKGCVELVNEVQQ